MPLRMTGMTSGLDTDSIVSALMEAQTTKKTKVENKKTKLEWTQNIWTGLNKKLYSFYTDSAGKMRFQSSYQTKKAASSDASILTATAQSSASSGSYTVKVNQLAAAQYVTSAKVSAKSTDASGKVTESKVTSDTKLSALGFDTEGDTTIEITAGEKTINLNVDETTTVRDFVNALKDAGLNASFDEKQGRFFISAKESGADGKFTITSKTMTGEQVAAQNKLMDSVDYSNLSSGDQDTVKKILSDLKNAQDTSAAADAEKSLQDISDRTAKEKATEYYNNKLTDDILSRYKYETDGTDGTGDAHKAGDIDYSKVKQALQNAGLDNNVYTDSDRLIVLKQKIIEPAVTVELASEEYTGKIDNAVTSGLEDAGIEKQSERYSTIRLAVNGYAQAMKDGTEQSKESALKLLGMDDIDGSAVKESADGTGMVVIEAADSIVQVNGATLTSSNTTLDVNGLSLNLVSASDREVKVTVSNDSTAVYDAIKDFVEQYNSALSEMNKYYYADSARGYDPLTDDQKEAMSDEEVEKWETKIKDSLLRRDSTLSGILETFRTSLTGITVKASDGKTYSLANLGITTGKDYKKYGLLHIKGDEDDTDYADSENTLQSMINSDPDIVMEVMSGIVSNLYDSINKKISTTTTMKSALSFYNDKEMTKQMTQYKKDIKSWETKLSDMEDRYYKQFSAMETALSKLQSQQNSLASYLGSN
ncbi:flagellar hook-associated 2 domain protein [Roseburia sp. CAG:380]|nr:flagellar hook-associated 2 domain protein [Roseburia sp. CAG:380]